MQTSYALHKINHANQFTFSQADYSKFKYGDNSIAQNFGNALAAGFINTHLKTNNNINQLVVISSPYAFIPTATFAMKNFFVIALNRWLAHNNYPVVQETKVYRTVTYKEDYGNLNAEDRMRLIGNDSFYIDATFLENKTLIFLDDIKITGSHEKMITKMLANYNIKNKTYLVYFAALINKNIPAQIENYLNNFVVKSVLDLDAIINNNNFAINTRIVKFILNNNAEDFLNFIKCQNTSFVNLLYDMAIGNNYHNIETYSKNLLFIKTTLLNLKN